MFGCCSYTALLLTNEEIWFPEKGVAVYHHSIWNNAQSFEEQLYCWRDCLHFWYSGIYFTNRSRERVWWQWKHDKWVVQFTFTHSSIYIYAVCQRRHNGCNRRFSGCLPQPPPAIITVVIMLQMSHCIISPSSYPHRNNIFMLNDHLLDIRNPETFGRQNTYHTYQSLVCFDRGATYVMWVL